MIGSKAEDIKTIGVIGAGTIGSSWASYFLATGRDVHAWDPADGAADKIRAFVENAWPSLETLGVVADGASPDRLTVFDKAADAAEAADFIQESAPERLDIKQALYADLEPATRPDVVISTSTSGLLMSELQAGRSHAGRFVLGHPFNPPHLIPLVEVLGGKATDPAIVDWTVDFYNAIGKRAIKVNKEVPGHVANRLQAAIWREAIHLAVEGVASVDDIDAAVAYGPGIRWSLMGPHLTFHLAGGPGGMTNFVEHLGPPVASWWDDLGSPQLTDAVKKTLIDGVADEVSGKTVPELAATRDRRLLAVLKALKDSEEG